MYTEEGMLLPDGCNGTKGSQDISMQENNKLAA